MKRREFITLVGGAAATPLLQPVAARAQQSATVPVIGYLSSLGGNERPNLVNAFRQGLKEGGGFIEGYNLAIEYRFAENQHDRLPALAADLAGRKVAVIVATGGGSSILAVKASVTSIPVVFTFGGDPVKEGFIESLNRPGPSITGIAFFGSLLSAKGLGLLHQVVPAGSTIGVLVNPTNLESASVPADLEEAARTLGRQLRVLNVASAAEIDAAFAILRREKVGALLVGSDPFLTGRRQQLVTLAARDVLPALYFNREFVLEGGLMSYGNDIPDVYRQAGLYAARVLKGEKPPEMPVIQSTKFEFVINLKTAKALGVTFPSGLLAIADEVIE